MIYKTWVFWKRSQWNSIFLHDFTYIFKPHQTHFWGILKVLICSGALCPDLQKSPPPPPPKKYTPWVMPWMLFIYLLPNIVNERKRRRYNLVWTSMPRTDKEYTGCYIQIFNPKYIFSVNFWFEITFRPVR